MINERKFIQQNLFGISTEHSALKKKKSVLSPEEKLRNKEKREAFIAWKILKSGKFREILTEKQKILLKKYKNIVVE